MNFKTKKKYSYKLKKMLKKILIFFNHQINVLIGFKDYI